MPSLTKACSNLARSVVLAAAVGSTVFASSAALGQNIPRGFEEQRAPDAATLASLVKPFIDALESGEVRRISTERERLLERLRNPRASVRFRLDLSDQVIQDIARFARSEESLVAGNALRVAGWIGTKDSIAVLVDALGSDSVVTRFAAASAARNTVSMYALSSPALTTGSAEDLVDALVERVETDEDHEVVGAALRSLTTARLAAGSSAGADEYRPIAFDAIARGAAAAGKRLAKAEGSPAENERLVTAALAMLIDVRGTLANGVSSLPEPLRCGVGTLGGHAIAHTKAAYLDAGPDFGGHRPLYVGLVDAAEKAIYYGEIGDGSVTNLAETLRSENSPRGERFQRAVLELVGPGGSLSRGDCSFQGDAFLGG